MVHADALHLHVLTVQLEAEVCAIFQIAEPEFRLICINYIITFQDLSLYIVQVRIVTIPQIRLINFDFLLYCLLCIRFN